MSDNLIDEFVIPKCSGKAFKVNRGQRLRVIEYEGKQVASLMFLTRITTKSNLWLSFPVV